MPPRHEILFVLPCCALRGCSHTTGRLLRHGPALAAAAMHDKEVPAVTALFAAYAQQPFSSGAPPVGCASQVGWGLAVGSSYHVLMPCLLSTRKGPVGAAHWACRLCRQWCWCVAEAMSSHELLSQGRLCSECQRVGVRLGTVRSGPVDMARSGNMWDYIHFVTLPITNVLVEEE